MVKKKGKKVNVKTKKEKKPTTKMTTSPAVWTPLDLFEDIDRYFFEDPWLRRSGWMRPWTGALIPDVKHTAVDMIDTGKEYKVTAEMPGVAKKDLEVSITPNNISICGETKTETKEEKKDYIRHERSYSTLCRNMRFPEEVNPDKAVATLNDGILEVKIPKIVPTKGRVIPVK